MNRFDNITGGTTSHSTRMPNNGNQMAGYKPLMWLTALLLTAVVVGCGGQDPILGGGGGGAPGGGGGGALVVAPGLGNCLAAVGNPLIPQILSSNPTNGNLVVPISTAGVAGGGKRITATFSLAMAPATINEAVATTAASTFSLKEALSGNNVAGTVTMNATNPINTIATLETPGPLTAGLSYTATITVAATAADATPLACTYQWSFTTVAGAGLAAVNPGLLAPFAMASFSPILNTGATKVNGDVVIDTGLTCNGLAVGATNDFGPGCNGLAVNPITNNPGDLVITQANPADGSADAVMVELLAKWNSISPAGIMPVVATDLGCGVIGTGGGAGVGIGCAGNATLPPGAYIAPIDSIGITGVLTLDGGGDQNAVWIFQTRTPSTINLNVGSRVILVNGAKASNVWWYVGSSSTLFTNSEMQGNILASASITMQNGATSCGRLLSGAEGAGGFVFDTNVVSKPGHPNAPATLVPNSPLICQ